MDESERKTLNFEALADFEPRDRLREHVEPTPDLEAWPSREPRREGQINIRGDDRILARFKKLCRDDRRTYIDMLRILMDLADRQGRGEN